MSIKILTLEEAEKTILSCAKYNECCEVVRGIAPCLYYCDNSGVEINIGDECAAVLILPSKKHHNYEHQLNLLPTYVISS